MNYRGLLGRQCGAFYNKMSYKVKKQFRLKDYDYSQHGAYFITICTKNRVTFFGDVKKGKMILNGIGNFADKQWQDIEKKYSNAILDEYKVMPNHVHVLIILDTPENAPRRVPTGISPLKKNSISSIVNHFKGNVKKWCKDSFYDSFAWQPRFYDRIVRSEKELEKIRDYIFYNPLKWEYEKDNPENLFM